MKKSKFYLINLYNMKNKNYNKKLQKINKKILSINVLIFVFLMATGSYAAEITDPLNGKSISDIIGTVILTLLGIVGSLSLIMFIYGGILWIISGGNEDNVKKGKETLKWAVLGIVIVFASYGILNFVIDAIAK